MQFHRLIVAGALVASLTAAAAGPANDLLRQQLASDQKRTLATLVTSSNHICARVDFWRHVATADGSDFFYVDCGRGADYVVRIANTGAMRSSTTPCAVMKKLGAGAYCSR